MVGGLNNVNGFVSPLVYRGQMDEIEVLMALETLLGKYRQQFELFETPTFLLMCSRYEKQRSSFISCLERSESAAKLESKCLSADKTKLRTELQDLQVQ